MARRSKKESIVNRVCKPKKEDKFVRPCERYLIPENEYVQSPEPVTIKELSRRWKGVESCSHSNLIRKCHQEKWPEKRKQFWSNVREKTENKLEDKLADGMASAMIEANVRHIREGKKLQSFGSSCFRKKEDGGYEIIDPSTGETISMKVVGDVVRMLKEGAELERKALGMADQVVNIKFARDKGRQFVDIVTKYVDDPVILKNILDEFNDIIQKESEELDRIVRGD